MTTAPEPNFDRIAFLYRWAEYAALGPALQRTRTALLSELGNPQFALLFGDGDGRFLEQLLLRYPLCNALAVDTSADMLAHLRRRCLRSVPNAAARLRTLRRSALSGDVPSATDLVVTHFFLDCLSQSEVEAFSTRLFTQLAPGALWLVSDFAVPSNPFFRPFASVYIRALYFFFRTLTGLRITHLPEPQQALAKAGFIRVTRQQSLAGLLYTELWRRP